MKNEYFSILHRAFDRKRMWNLISYPVWSATLHNTGHFWHGQCCGAGPFLTGSGSGSSPASRFFFFTGSGSFSYKNRLKSSKKHVFAFTSLHRLRLGPKSTGSATLGMKRTRLRNKLRILNLSYFLDIEWDNYFCSVSKIMPPSNRLIVRSSHIKMDGRIRIHCPRPWW